MLRHVVLFKFKAEAGPGQVTEIEASFRALVKEIKEIRDFEWGTNNSPEDLAQGFTHCFVLSFESGMDRDYYLPHPAHQAFIKNLKPILDKALVIDYEVRS
jgi:hypothetical protein